MGEESRCGARRTACGWERTYIRKVREQEDDGKAKGGRNEKEKREEGFVGLGSWSVKSENRYDRDRFEDINIEKNHRTW